MEYSPDELDDLISDVESQGGALLPETCEGRFAIYAIPGSDKTIKAQTCGCGNNTMLVAPYEPAANAKDRKKLLTRGAGFVRACAVCDDVGSWPRFMNWTQEEN